MGAKIDLIGKQFGKLVVIAENPERDKRKNVLWRCRCGCGTQRDVIGQWLRDGKVTHFPCCRHHQSGSTEHIAWSSMKERCINPDHQSYRYYGARGIKVFEPWLTDFKKFYEYVGPKPGPEYSLDRIECDGNYEPGNIRWATPKQQILNRKIRSFSFDGYQEAIRGLGTEEVSQSQTPEELATTLSRIALIANQSGLSLSKIAKLSLKQLRNS